MLQRKLKKKEKAAQLKNNPQSEKPEPEVLFYKVARTFTSMEMKPEQHAKIMTSIRTEVKKK